MHDDKQPERRTYLQERFEILIKRQKEGTATFNQLTELDEIVNRDPELRERVIREDILMEDPSDSNTATPVSESESIRPGYKTVFGQIRAFLQRIFNLKFGAEVISGPELQTQCCWFESGKSPFLLKNKLNLGDSRDRGNSFSLNS